LRSGMKKHPSILALVAVTASSLRSGCAGISDGPSGNLAVPQPAKSVELSRYLGRWYEVGRYEASFQKDCEAVTADYSLNDNGTIKVVNSCRQVAIDGKLRIAKGKAKIVEGSENAKLRVSFFGPFYGDYWVLDRADNYSWAIVGEPSGRYLWLLARTANPDEDVKSNLLQRAAALGYDVSLIRPTRHPQ